MSSTAVSDPAGAARRRLRLARGLSHLLAFLVCLHLGLVVHATRWTMDADEAVHAVEALRLQDDLARGRPGAFLADAYFPERWAPPVHPHLRWYPPVHALCLVPFYALLGPSDFSARIPSVLFLFATALVFLELARRLSPHPAASGLLAVVLLLGAPNVLTFSAQSLIATTSLFTCYLALLAYVVSLEAGHPPRRAALAGLALGVAMLTKYDHGGFLALSLGLAEVLRARGSPRVFARSWAPLLFGVALSMVALWFAHPDKIQTLRDSAGHPFFGTPRTIVLDFLVTWFTEYAASLAVGLLGVLSYLALFRRRSEPAVAAILVWGGLATVFYALRGRFHFRYDFVEAPLFLLSAALVLPTWIERAADMLAAAATRRRRLLAGAAWVLTALVVFVGLRITLRPAVLFDALRGPFVWFHGLRADHWGMKLAPLAYVDGFAADYAAFAAYLGGSLAALATGGFLLASGALFASLGRTSPRALRVLVVVALAVAAVPGMARLQLRLRDMVDWELECQPELNDVYTFVGEHGGAKGTTLLGGGWDQLSNNALRWYLITRTRPRPAFDEVRVVGDMIGSIVFPAEPRIAYWTELLATAQTAELPDRVVLVTPGPRFLYHTRIGPEAALYRRVIEERGCHALAASRSFPILDCTVDVYLRTDSAPIEPPVALMEELGVLGGVAPESSRAFAGEGGWILKDESLRHFVRHRPARPRGGEHSEGPGAAPR